MVVQEITVCGGVLFGDMWASDHSICYVSTTVLQPLRENQKIKGNLKVFVSMNQNRCDAASLLASVEEANDCTTPY